MKQRDPRAFLFDIRRACELIGQFTAGLTLESFVADPKTQSAVERQLEIVGEAIGQMIKHFPELKQDFPEAPRIISFRNFLIHGYADVSSRVVWGICESHLPELADKVESLLAREWPDIG